MVPDLPEMCNCSALRQAARHISRMYDEALAPVGLGTNQYSILSRLERSGPLAQNKLAERLVMDRSTLGHLLRPLERRGLLGIAVDPDDRRRKLLALSTIGQELLDEARPRWSAAQARFEGQFGAAEAERLRTTLMQVTNVPLRADAGGPDGGEK
jgi:DNA-binding MarR family transcriptional regulator